MQHIHTALFKTNKRGIDMHFAAGDMREPDHLTRTRVEKGFGETGEMNLAIIGQLFENVLKVLVRHRANIAVILLSQFLLWAEVATKTIADV